MKDLHWSIRYYQKVNMSLRETITLIGDVDGG